jgi:hypothetical protein
MKIHFILFLKTKKFYVMLLVPKMCDNFKLCNRSCNEKGQKRKNKEFNINTQCRICKYVGFWLLISHVLPKFLKHQKSRTSAQPIRKILTELQFK